MVRLRLSPGSLMLFIGVARLSAAFVPFSQSIALSPRVDPMHDLFRAESEACAHNPGRFPACRKWRQRTRDDNDLGDRVRSFRDKTYTIEVTIGNPGERFDVALDTGSRALWITAPQCNTGGCETSADVKHPRRHFNYSASSSFRTNLIPYNLTYGGADVQGFLATDALNVGPLRVNGQDLVMAKNLSDGLAYFGADGLIGLSFPRLKQEVPSSALENLNEDIQLFTVFLKKNVADESADGGAISWGSLDAKNCQDDVTFIPLIHLHDTEKNPYNLWTFPIDEFEFNGVKYGEGEGWFAASDTGSSTIRAPLEPMEEFLSKNNATWDPVELTYRAPCDTPFVGMMFVIGGKEYEVPPHQFVTRSRNVTRNDCVLAVDKQGGESDQPEFLLGQPFIRTVCHIYDMAQARIGFANHN